MVSLECVDSDGVLRQCHTVLSMHCGDIPEAKDLACVKWGKTTNQPCHRCHVAASNLNKYARYPKRKMKEAVETIQRSSMLLSASLCMPHLGPEESRLKKNSMRAEAKNLLNRISISSRIPVLYDWP